MLFNTSFVGEPIPEPAKVVFVVAGVVLIIVGILGNVTIMYTVYRSKSLNYIHFYLLFNLSLADLVISGYMVPSVVFGLVSGYYPVINELHCELNGFICTMSFNVSLNSILTITIMRYLTFCRKELVSRMSSESIMTIISCVWVLSGIQILPACVGLSQFHFDPKLHYCTVDRTFNVSYTKFLVLANIALPMTVICVTCLVIWWYVHRAAYKMARLRERASRIRHDSIRNDIVSALVETSKSLANDASEVDCPLDDTSTTLTSQTTKSFLMATIETMSARYREPRNLNFSRTRDIWSEESLTQYNGASTLAHSEEEIRRASLALFQKESTIDDFLSELDRQWEAKRAKRDKFHLVKSLVIYSVAFSVLMTPYMAVMLSDTSNQRSSVVYLFCSYMWFASASVDWLVYGAMNKKFLNALKKLVFGGAAGEKDTSTASRSFSGLFSRDWPVGGGGVSSRPRDNPLVSATKGVRKTRWPKVPILLRGDSLRHPSGHEGTFSGVTKILQFFTPSHRTSGVTLPRQTDKQTPVD